MALTPSQIRRTKSPKSPKPKHCVILDSDVEVDLEIQNVPPYRILPKVRKPKTPPPPRPNRRPEVRNSLPPRTSPACRHRYIGDDNVADVIFYKRPSPPRQVSFHDHLEMIVPRDIRVPSGLVDILTSVDPKAHPEKLSPVVISPGKSTSKNPNPGEQKVPKANSACQTDLPQVLEKPKVTNVHIVRRSPTTKTSTATKRRLTQSNEELNKVDLIRELCDLSLNLNAQTLRSSFIDPDAPVDPSRKSVYIDLGDYQTLLKHSKHCEHVYSLPQPQCYGDDTLRAVKLITDKYDTFQRRIIQAESFQEKAEPGPSDPSLPSVPVATVKPVAVTDIVLNSPAEAPDSPDTDITQLKSAFASAEQRTIIGKTDALRLDLFYRSYGTDVHVCQCFADLCLGKLAAGAEEVTDWELVHTGVPLMVLDTGYGHRGRQLQVVLAERETGFPLWQDKICYLTNYAEISADEHTFFLSESLRTKGKLKFHSAEEAGKFLSWFKEVTVDPNDELWKVSSKKNGKKKPFKSKRRRRKPDKKDISSPCNFTHVTRISTENESFLCVNIRNSLSSDTADVDYSKCAFRPRLPTS